MTTCKEHKGNQDPTCDKCTIAFLLVEVAKAETKTENLKDEIKKERSEHARTKHLQARLVSGLQSVMSSTSSTYGLIEEVSLLQKEVLVFRELLLGNTSSKEED